MTTYTLFGQANPGAVNSGAGNAGTNGLHFTVSAASQLDGIWHYSPATSTQLPTQIGLYTTQASPATGTLVHSETASWSGAAGSGWVFAAFASPPALTAGTNYMATQWRNDATSEWFVFYAVTWPVSSGIITAPKDTGTGQGWFDTGTPTAMTFPATQLAGDNWGMDVQVSTPSAPSGQPQRQVRGKKAAARARLASTPAAPASPPPSKFRLPGLLRGRPQGPKSRIVLPKFPPAVPSPPPVPSPFSPPSSIWRAHQAARKARLSSARGAALPPPPFATPARVQRGRPAARKSRLGLSAGSPAVIAPLTPSPFSPPALLKRGKAAARRARLARSAGTPAVPVTVTVTGTWTGAYAVASGFFFPYPAARPVQVPVTNTAGDWLFAVIAWRPSVPGADVSVCVADDAHNWWEPVGAPVADSGAGAVRTAVWAAPAARVANSLTGVTNVQVAATGPVLAVTALIADIAGLQPWYSVAAIGSGYAGAATSLPLSAGVSPAPALLFCGLAHDNSSVTVTGPGGGWGTLATVTASNGVDHAADLELTAAWLDFTSTGTVTGSASASASTDLAGVIAGVLIPAPQPSQPSPYWPVMVTEAAVGSGVQTPPSEMTWTALSGRSLSLDIRQGKQYSLGQLQAGQGTLALDDPDGALIPPGTGAYAGIDSGTPVRRRVTWPGLPGSPSRTPHYVAFSGYIRRWPWNMDAELYRGQVQAEITDAWGYGNGQLNAMAIEECLIDSPNCLWPLNDPAGSAGAGNLVPGGPGLALAVSKFGAGGATVTWGANSVALPGMSSAQVTSSGKPGGASGMPQFALSGTSLALPGYGYALTASSTSYPPVTGGVTVECWAQDTAAAVLAGISGNGLFEIAVTGGTFNTAQSSFPNGLPVVLGTLSGFTFPAPFTAGVTYYVTAGDGNGNYSLAATPGGAAITPTTSGVTAGTVTPVLAWNPVILAARVQGAPVAQLEADKASGVLLLRYRPAGAVTDTVVTVDASVNYLNETFLRHFSLAFNRTTWRVLIDAGQLVTASGTFSSPLPASFTDLSFAGVMDRTSQGQGWPGYLGGPAGVYPGVSPQVRVVNRYEAAWLGMVNEAACDRAERVLEYAGLTGRRWLGQQVVTYEGDLTASGRDVGGQAAVSAVNNVTASTAPAISFVAPTGDIVYHSKLYCWNQPVRWVLGTNAAGGEIPFSPAGVATDYDPSRVTAQVQLAQLDSQSVTVPGGVMSATTMAAVAAAAGRQYGGQPYQQTGYLAADWSSAYTAGGSLVDLANWVQAVFARPANRIAQVTVNAASYPAAWPFWAGASVGDMVQVNIRVPTAATSPLISLVARVTQTARSSRFSQQATSATITCTLDFAPEYSALTCDDPVRGKLDGTNVLPW